MKYTSTQQERAELAAATLSFLSSSSHLVSVKASKYLTFQSTEQSSHSEYLRVTVFRFDFVVFAHQTC